MKNIIIEKNVLENVVATAVNYLPTKESDMEGMLTLAGNGKKFSISTTNYAEKLILSEIEYSSDELELPKFSFSVDGKKLLHVVRSIKANSLKFAIDDNKEITISGGRNKVKLEVSDLIFDFVLDNIGNSLNVGKLFDGFKSILHSVDSNNPKIELNGASLQCNNGTLSLVGTDTRRLSVFTTDNDSPCNIIIDKASIKSILKLFDGLEPSAVTTDTSLTVWTENVTYNCKLIGGSFPQWQRIVPQKLAQTFSFDRVKLIEMLKEASIFNSNVEVEIGNGMVKISDLDGNADTLEYFETGNADIKFKVNSKFMLDFLTSYGDELVQIGFNEPKLPIMLIANPNYKEVVMPYIVNEGK